MNNFDTSKQPNGTEVDAEENDKATNCKGKKKVTLCFERRLFFALILRANIRSLSCFHFMFVYCKPTSF